MSFETPAALWSLLSLLLLALFSLWRQAAEPVTVPSLRLWKLIPERNPPIKALRRPRWRFELLLQAAALALLCGALAGPYRETERHRPRRVAFVIDTSPRLAAGGRLERLLTEARSLASGPFAEDDLVWYAGTGRVEGPGAVQIAERHVDLAPLAAAAAASSERLLVFSDRPLGKHPSRTLAGPAANAGLVAAAAGPDGIFARIVNHGPARDAVLVADLDGRAERHPLRLGPGATAWSRPLDLSKVSRVRLRLDGDDGFAADDAAEFVRGPAAELAVAVGGRHHEGLVRALEAVPGVVTARGAVSAGLSVAWDAEPAKAEWRVRLHSPAVRAPGAVKIHAHPATRGLSGRESELAAAGLGELPPEFRAGTKLLEAGGKVAGALRGKDLHLSVDLDAWSRSSPSFPIFWSDVADLVRVGASGFTLASGLLDERESDARGEERALPADLASPAGRERRRASLGGWAALLALLALGASWGLQRRGG
jgi:hypothetical protein